MKRITLSVFTIFLFGIISIAQNVQKSIDELSTTKNAMITLNNLGIAEFIKFPKNQPLELEGNSVYEKTISFLDTYKGVFDLKSVDDSFVLESAKTDNYGFKNVTLIQVYRGVPIFDGKLKFHFNIEEKLTAVNGTYIPNINLNAEPSVNEAEASNIAIETINNQNINDSDIPLLVRESTLYVFKKGLVQGYHGANYLVYRNEITNDNDVREYVFVDAHNGDIIEQFTGIAHVINRAVYESVLLFNPVWQEGDAFPGALTIPQQNIVVTSDHVYNFFKNAFSVVSYDNADAQMIAVNNAVSIENCPNANWDGTKINFCDGVASDDVIGHEWAHAYTQYTNDLIYAWQSGAINESYSDIWGETIDLINNYGDEGEDHSLRTGCNTSDRWIEGEDTVFNGLRDMWDPTCKGDPGKVTDTQYWCDIEDNGGVHHNSGIPNHTYALLVDGGSYNGLTINGIGFTKAAHIFWRAQSQYLTISSDFASFADALEASCADLIGINLEGLSVDLPFGPSGEIITTNDLAQVANAIAAVELRTTPDCPDFMTILSPLNTELCGAATDNPIYFEDWEGGLNNWSVEQLPVNAVTWLPRDWIIFNGPSLSNRIGNVMYGATNAPCSSEFVLQNGVIRLESPVINIPDLQEGTFEMAFNHAITMDTDLDGANVKYSLDGGLWTVIPPEAFTENPYNSLELLDSDNPLNGEPVFTGINIGVFLPWGTSVVNLSSIGVIANSTIQFSFEIGTGGCTDNLDIGWGIDEVMVYNCAQSLSVDEINLVDAISIFPNPSNGIFTMQKINSINLIDATVYDINGRYIMTINLENMENNKSIDLSSVASGMYFMSVRSQTSKHVVKLVKQ